MAGSERDPTANGEGVGAQHESARREAAVAELLETLARASFELQPVLQTIVERAAELCDAEEGNVARRDGDVFRVAAFVGYSSDAYERLTRERPYRAERGSIIGRAILERDVVHVEDVLADPEYQLHDAQRLGGYRTVLAVPMIRNEELIGVVAVGRRRVERFSDRQVSLLKAFADQASLAIENVRLFQSVERQLRELSRFAPQVASLLSSEEGIALLTGHRREISALFADLRGFTAFAETAEPEEVLGVLREYHSAVGELALENGGTVEHFAGDGLMVFFNDPVPVDDHQLAAVRTAVAMRDRCEELARGWRKRGYELGLGIGIASGYATLGRIGFPGRYDYGAIGNVVILASRLSDAAAPGQILISQRLHAAIDGSVEAETMDEMALKGISRPVAAFAVTRLANGARHGGG